MAEQILQLVQLISNSAEDLVKTCDDLKLPLPHLHTLEKTPDAFRQNSVAREATNVIIAAALQLAATLAPPSSTMQNIACAHFKTAALRTCIESSVTEILREEGSEGIHVEALAKKCGLNGSKLSRILRVLANDHIYREITPDVFTNTRLSIELDTGKSINEIQAEPECKHDGTQGFVALLEQMSSDPHKSSAYLYEVLKDPATAHSDDPCHTPMHRAFNITIPRFKWYELPEQAYRRRRFAIAMQGIGAIQSSDVLLQAFDWKRYQGSPSPVVVDVGGGIGASILPVVKANQHLSFVIEDLPHITELGRQFYTQALPEAVETRRVQFQNHDFLTPQPVQSPAVFVLYHIIHNWSDKNATRILRHLRDAAGPDTRLLVADFIVAYTCKDSADEAERIPGATLKPAPAPLLANYGAVNETAYGLDMNMMTNLNAEERTFGKLYKLLLGAGWKIVRAHRGNPPGDFVQPVEAIPV
ncbi:hypothetical protein HGRIS_002991 [Hohenbuehelia grisea]|uniref:O-methyltransferase domain-containing protein n=1 Tax=Hohenbuehelia grisea TaxID=104357 RepID=A0ABR3JM51_9AGAR